jgi:hypothetical protein
MHRFTPDVTMDAVKQRMARRFAEYFEYASHTFSRQAEDVP